MEHINLFNSEAILPNIINEKNVQRSLKELTPINEYHFAFKVTYDEIYLKGYSSSNFTIRAYSFHSKSAEF